MRLHESVNIAELREGIEHDLRELASPLVTRLATIDSQIAGRLEDLAELRTVRAEVVRALRPIVGEDAIPIEPGRNAKPGPKHGTRRNGKQPAAYESTQVGDETVERVLGFIREHYGDGREFTGTDVFRDWRDAGDNPSENSIRASVARLRDREQIRFVKKGRGGSTLYSIVEGR